MSQPEKEIAELHRANAALQRRVAELTRSLELAGKDIGALSYAISHDVRAPLRVVDGFCQMFMEDFGADVPLEGRRLLENAREGSRRMSRLIDDVLVVTRYMRELPNKRTVRMKDLVTRIVDELVAEQKGRRFDIRIGELPDCEADAAMIEHALRQLVANAIKFSRGRDPAVIAIEGTESAGEILYTISDNGAGFNMKYVGKLFELFGRLHSPSEFEGSGTGLVTVHRIVVHHGGRVAAESQPGTGAKFTFTIPRVEAAAQA